MKAKVYYQDLALNASSIDEGFIIKDDRAVEIYEFDFDKHMAENTESNRLLFIHALFTHMNLLDVPVGHEDRHLFEKAGHTSMSIGDYVKFDDGMLMICGSHGWDVVQTKFYEAVITENNGGFESCITRVLEAYSQEDAFDIALDIAKHERWDGDEDDSPELHGDNIYDYGDGISEKVSSVTLIEDIEVWKTNRFHSICRLKNPPENENN